MALKILESPEVRPSGHAEKGLQTAEVGQRGDNVSIPGGISGTLDAITNDISALSLELNELMISVGAESQALPPLVAPKRLRPRLAACDDYANQLLEKTRLLQVDVRGASDASSVTDITPPVTPVKLSVRRAIDALTEKITVLKRHLTDVAVTPLLTEISAVEEYASLHKSKLDAMSKNLGLSPMVKDSEVTKETNLKQRLVVLEKYFSLASKVTTLLEAELLPSSATSAEMPQEPTLEATSIAARLSVAKGEFEHLKSRMSALEAVPVLAKVEKLEELLKIIEGKVTGVSTALGETRRLEAFLPQTEAALKTRIMAIEQYALSLHSNLKSLEVEMNGAEQDIPKVENPTSLSGRVEALHTVIENMRERALSLES